MATHEVEKPMTSNSSKHGQSPKDNAPQPASVQPKQADDSPPLKPPLSSKQFIVSVAANISYQPLPTYDPNVWGVLTAISYNARKRPLGMNMILTADEHRIGRLAEDTNFRIESNSVSAKHCIIYRKRGIDENTEQSSNCSSGVFLKDTRDALKSAHASAGVCAKRKADEFACETKRLKGIGIGAPEGPISLDDFRRLRRSNKELRKQLEDLVRTLDKLRNENHATVEHHENEIKEIKESVANSYLDRLKELEILVDVKLKELVEVGRISAEQKHAIEDLNERLSASMLSCIEANERIMSQKSSMAELKVQIEEERDQRREEREKAAIDLKAAVQRVQSEAQEEMQRLSDVALK